MNIPAAITSTAVPQRRYDDGVIAAVANALGWEYERAAEALGFPCDQETGLPLIPNSMAIRLQSAIAPLLAEGISAASLVSREHPHAAQVRAATRSGLFPSERIKALLAGRRALVVAVWAEEPEPTREIRGRVLAWDGMQFLGENVPPDLAGITIWETLVLTPSGEPETSPPPIKVEPVDPANLSELFARHERVFLAFSGGKESIILAHMCERWREKVTLLWVRVQHAAPHMVEFVRSYRDKGWHLEEIEAPHLMTHWQEAGTPADVIPVVNTLGRAEPHIQSWVSCCYAIRQMPLNAFLWAHGQRCALIHGQRTEDKAAPSDSLTKQLPAHVEIVQPLRDWREQAVLAYVDANGLTLPSQYYEGLPDSLECVVCPAALTARRLAYLDKRYPFDAHLARKVAMAAHGGALQALVKQQSVLFTTEMMPAI